MIKFKVNGKPVEIPSNYDDLKMRHFIGISKPGNDTNRLISLLTGLDYEMLKNAMIIGLEQVIAAIQFLNEPMKFGQAMPDRIGKYKLPVNSKGQFNIQFESLGQFEDMRSDMKPIKTALDLTEAYPKFCARYLQKIRDGEYDPQKAEQMVEEVLEMPAKEVIILGSFFYVKLMSLLNGTPKTSPSTAPNLKKSKPGSKGSRNNSASTRQSITSRLKSGSRRK